jgi:hypothetical protein
MISESDTEPAVLWSTDIWSPPYALLKLAFLVSISSYYCNATFVLQNAIVQKTYRLCLHIISFLHLGYVCVWDIYLIGAVSNCVSARLACQVILD